MAHYHMSWDDLLWKIPWATMQRIMIDAPNYKPKKIDEKAEKKADISMTKDNVQDIIAMMNSGYKQ